MRKKKRIFLLFENTNGLKVLILLRIELLDNNQIQANNVTSITCMLNGYFINLKTTHAVYWRILILIKLIVSFPLQMLEF